MSSTKKQKRTIKLPLDLLLLDRLECQRFPLVRVAGVAMRNSMLMGRSHASKGRFAVAVARHLSKAIKRNSAWEHAVAWLHIYMEMELRFDSQPHRLGLIHMCMSV